MPKLAEPEAELKRHSRQLCRHIRDHIAHRRGWIGFDRYMQEALYAPGLGYYSAGQPCFGAAGDFVTAPVLGEVAARCLAQQCAEVLAAAGGDVLEFGAGDGRLAAGLLPALEALDYPPARYFIMETSAALQARQRETLAALAPDLRARVQWLDQLPAGFTGVVLANEVLDAMPAIRFEVDADGRARELGVAVRGGEDDDDGDNCNDPQSKFHWSPAAPLPATLQQRLNHHELTPGYRGEIGLRAEAWVRTLGAVMARGVLLIIDYGFPRREFYHAERRHGTLMCHYRHAAHDDPFFYPGLQDISVHLDFTALTDAARDAALTLAGFTSQGAFLLALGALDLLAAQQQAATTAGGNGNDNDNDTRAALAMSREIQILTQPHEMGEIFKVIAFTRNYDHPLRGFSLTDRRGAVEAT